MGSVPGAQQYALKPLPQNPCFQQMTSSVRMLQASVLNDIFWPGTIEVFSGVGFTQDSEVESLFENHLAKQACMWMEELSSQHWSQPFQHKLCFKKQSHQLNNTLQSESAAALGFFCGLSWNNN